MAWGPVLGVATAAAALLLALAQRYGWHRDELYFLEAGKHLAWGYVDQPPFTPALARLADAIAPGNLVVLRSWSAAATGVTTIMGALIVREMGGRRPAQIAGALAMGTSGFVLGVGHLLSTATFDLTAWMTLLWLATRLLRTNDPRWWLAFGGAAGLSMLNKNLLILLGTALLCGLLAERRWDLLRSPWLVAGVALAAAIASPNLVWQARNGWPQIDMARALSARLATENRAALLPLQVLFAPGLVVLLWRGARSLRRDDAVRHLRSLLWAWPAGLVVVFVTAGRAYYLLPLTLTVVLAGVAATERSGRLHRIAWHLVPNLTMSLVFAVPLLPLASVKATGNLNEVAAETVGWPQLTRQVADVVEQLPAHEQRHVVLLGRSYGEAGALDRFGSAHGLPPAYSPHNSYADFRQPTDAAAPVVAVRFRASDLRRYFTSCEQVATVDNGLGIDNEVQGAPILVCRGLRHPWPETWSRLRFLS